MQTASAHAGRKRIGVAGRAMAQLTAPSIFYQANGASRATIWAKIFGLAAMMSPLCR